MGDTATIGRRGIWHDNRAVALLLAAMLTTMANATISPALPSLERLFVADPNAAMLTRLLVPAPSLGVAVFAPVVGLLADRFGRRPLLLSGMVLFVAAGCAGVFLPDLATIFASRLVLGIAVALIMTAQTALVGDYFTGDDRSTLAGLQISARNFGGFVFVSLAGWAAAVSPRWPFAIYGLALVVLPFVAKSVVEPVRGTGDAALVSCNDATRRPAWRLPFFALVLLQAATNMLFFLMPTELPFFFAAAGRESTIESGLALGTLMLAGGGIALVYAPLRRRIGSAGVFTCGYAAMAAGFFLLVQSGASSLAFAATAFVGAGYAVVSPTFLALALQLAPDGRRGMAGGLLTTSVFIGQFLSPLVGTPVVSVFGYGGLFGASAVLLTAMSITALVVSRWSLLPLNAPSPNVRDVRSGSSPKGGRAMVGFQADRPDDGRTRRPTRTRRPA